MKHRRLFLNAVTTLLQVLGSAVVLFFLYRFLIRRIGMDGLGIWSLILATTSIVALANQGFSASIVKFVAQYAARENHERVALLVETAILSIGGALALADLALYHLARWALALVLTHARLADAYIEQFTPVPCVLLSSASGAHHFRLAAFSTGIGAVHVGIERCSVHNFRCAS